jgi:hypothetical protein
MEWTDDVVETEVGDINSEEFLVNRFFLLSVNKYDSDAVECQFVPNHTKFM